MRGSSNAVSKWLNDIDNQQQIATALINDRLANSDSHKSITLRGAGSEARRKADWVDSDDCKSALAKRRRYGVGDGYHTETHCVFPRDNAASSSSSRSPAEQGVT